MSLASSVLRRLADWQDRKSMLVATIALLVACRLVAWSATGKLGHSVGYEMPRLAARIVEGYGYSCPYGPPRYAPTAQYAPLYVGFAAAVFYVFGTASYTSYLFLQCTNLVLQSITLIVMVAIIRRKLSPLAAGVFALLFATNPLLIFQGAATWENSLTALLVTVIAYDVLLNWRPGMSALRLGLFGVLLGLTSMSNPVWTLCWVPLCPLALSKEMGLRIRQIPARLVLIVIGFLIVVAPWAVRNSLLTGQVTFIQGMKYTHLYSGNNPEAWGGHGRGMRNVLPLDSRTQLAKLVEKGERAFEEEMREAFLQEISARPLAFVGRCVLRVFMFWLGDADRLAEAVWKRDWGITALCVLSLIVCTVEIVFGIPGWARARRQSRGIWVFSVYCLAMPLPYYFMHVGFRYRSMLSAFLLAFAAFWCVEKLTERAARYERPPSETEAPAEAAAGRAQ